MQEPKNNTQELVTTQPTALPNGPKAGNNSTNPLIKLLIKANQDL